MHTIVLHLLCLQREAFQDIADVDQREAIHMPPPLPNQYAMGSVPMRLRVNGREREKMVELSLFD